MFSKNAKMWNERNSEKSRALFAWLFPIIYLIHIGEEYSIAGGFYAYISKTPGVNMTATRFLILSSFGWLLIIVGILIARRLRFSSWLFVYLGVVSIANAITHINLYLKDGNYNPGLATGTLLFLPLGGAAILLMGKKVSWPKFLLAAATGISTNNVIVAELTVKSEQLWHLF